MTTFFLNGHRVINPSLNFLMVFGSNRMRPIGDARRHIESGTVEWVGGGAFSEWDGRGLIVWQ
jgi:hypothetical protein